MTTPSTTIDCNNNKKNHKNASITSQLRPNITRIRDKDGFIGTVKYIGPVASAKDPIEIYAGVEWDDNTRGKHDGSVVCRRTNQLMRHFSCSNPSRHGRGNSISTTNMNGSSSSSGNVSTGGSFLRISKLDLGVALDERVLESKYVKEGAELVAPGNILPNCYARTSSGLEKQIELVGELHIRARQQLDDLNHVSLRCLGIARAADPAVSESYCHLKGLDLAGNMLSDWEDAAAILRQFPSLEHVSLTSNRIRDISWSAPYDFSRIKILNLNDCSIGSFQTLQTLDLSMPLLEELCVAHNDLSDLYDFDCRQDVNGAEIAQKASTPIHPEEITAPLLSFQHLSLLDCSNCNLTSWDRQIRRFRSLPLLKTFILNDNPIPFVPCRSITHTTSDDKQICDNDTTTKSRNTVLEFYTLQSLQLSGTSIETWNAATEGIAQLASLKSLRFRNCPVTSQMGASEARAIMIARLPQIEHLNASPITAKERTEAERRYIRNVARELGRLGIAAFAPSSSESGMNADVDTTVTTETNKNAEQQTKEAEMAIFAQHPRFHPLLEKHGNAMILSNNNRNPMGGKLANETVNVTIRSMAAISCTMEPLQKRLPGSLKVGRLKSMCARAFHVDVDLQILHFRAEKDPFPTELDDNEHTLSYYGVSDGAEILMNEVDTTTKSKNDQASVQKANDDHNDRVTEQEMNANAIRQMQQKELKAQSNGASSAAAAAT